MMKKALPWQEVPDSNCERRNVTTTGYSSKTVGTGQKRAYLQVAGEILQSWAQITTMAITVCSAGAR